MSDDQYREASEDQWGTSAEAWRRAAEKPEEGASAAMARWMLDRAGLQPGERVLELAAGAGRVGLQAAELVGPQGTVVCSDFSAPMVDAIRERAAELGLDNVDARVLDAEKLELGEEERFDVLLCRNGYMLMADPAAALRESHRALRPGGRLALGLWGRAAGNPWLTAILDPIMEHFGAPPPPPGTPGPFALGDEGRVEELLLTAGFSDVTTERLACTQPHASLEQWWSQILEISAPIAAMLASQPEEVGRKIHDAALAANAEYVREDGSVELPSEAVVALAVRG